MHDVCMHVIHVCMHVGGGMRTCMYEAYKACITAEKGPTEYQFFKKIYSLISQDGHKIHPFLCFRCSECQRGVFVAPSFKSPIGLKLYRSQHRVIYILDAQNHSVERLAS